jgi:hypothetical protein
LKVVVRKKASAVRWCIRFDLRRTDFKKEWGTFFFFSTEKSVLKLPAYAGYSNQRKPICSFRVMFASKQFVKNNILFENSWTSSTRGKKITSQWSVL